MVEVVADLLDDPTLVLHLADGVVEVALVGLKDFAFDEGMLGMTPAAP